MSERVGAWAADYFDAGQALWAAPTGKTAYAAWRAVAIHDLTPEIVGLKGFASRIADAPEQSDAAILAAAQELGLGEDMLETYFHQLLMSLGGWAQLARYKLWRAELADETSDILTDLLAIRLAWETALFAQYEDRISDQWDKTCSEHAEPLAPNLDLLVDSILQSAAEKSAQRDLIATLQSKAAICTLRRATSFKRRSASMSVRRCFAAHSKALTRTSRQSALPASSVLPRCIGALHPMSKNCVCRSAKPGRVDALRRTRARRQGPGNTVCRSCQARLGAVQVGGGVLVCLCGSDGACLCGGIGPGCVVDPACKEAGRSGATVRS